MTKPLSFLLGIFLFCYANSSTAQSLPSPSTLFKRQIIFGTGGGVTGFVKSYILEEDGKVLQKESTSDSVKVIKTLNEFQTKDAFKCADQLKLDKLKFNHPGNLYYFIEYQYPKKNIKAKTTWGNKRYNAPKSVKKFYYKLLSLIA